MARLLLRNEDVSLCTGLVSRLVTLPASRTSRQPPDGESDPTVAVVYIKHKARAGWGNHPARSVCPGGTMMGLRDARRPGQAAARGRRDVRRRGRAVRPDQHRALLRAGPGLAPGHPGGARPAAGRAGARPGRRHRRLHRGAGPRPGRSRSAPTSRSACCRPAAGPGRRVPLLAGDALRLPFADAAFDAVTISFALRNVVDTAGGAARAGPGHPAGRPPGGLRVQPPDQRGVPHGLPAVPDALAAGGGPRRVAATPTRTSTWPSRSAPGRTRPGWPRASREAGRGRGSAGAT